MKELFKVLKDHKNPFMEELVSSSYQYCFRDEFESFVGDADSVDLDECGTENVVRVCLVNPSFYSSLSWALKKLQDAKLVIDQFGFQLDGSAVPRESEIVDEQARLSDKLTVLVNDIGITMKRLGYALYGGKVYKKCDKAKYTYSYKCEVEAFVNSLAANESFKARLLKDMKKVIDILANPHCEVIRPLCVDYNLIEVNDGKCWSIRERRFLENAIADKDIGYVTPRAFSSYDPTREPEPKYFKDILENSLTEAEIEEFCEDFLRLLNYNQKKHKDKVPCLIGAANSGKTSLFQPILGLVHHGNIATITKQRVFNKAMINQFTEVIFVDEASPSTLDIDDWKILTQGGYTVCDIKYQTAKSFINRCPMLLTAQQKLEFGPEDQAAMDRRLKNYVFKSLPYPKKKAAEWLRKHSMDCKVWASTKARTTTDQEESSDSSLGEEQIGDGVLKDEEKDALRTLPLAEVWTDTVDETGETTGTTADAGSDNTVASDDDQCIRNLRRALGQSSTGSLRHRQIASILHTRVREKEDENRRRRELHKARRSFLTERGVSSEIAELLPEDPNAAMPSQIQRQLQKHCDEQVAHQEQERREKARRAFEGTWIRATEVELKNCCDKYQSSSDPTVRTNVKEWMKVLCDKLKRHHESFGTFNTAEAVQERIKVCTALGLLREEQQHLVTSVAERLPVLLRPVLSSDNEGVNQHAYETDEECSIFITQQCNDAHETEEVESIFITPLSSTSGASTPHSSFDDCAVSAALLRASTTNKKKRKRQSNSQRVPKKSQNVLTKYFTSQK